MERVERVAIHGEENYVHDTATEHLVFECIPGLNVKVKS